MFGCIFLLAIWGISYGSSEGFEPSVMFYRLGNSPSCFQGCTATLIKPQYALTAARCYVPRRRHQQLNLFYGCSNVYSDPSCKSVRVVDVMVHPKYKPDEMKNFYPETVDISDIAVLKLQSKLDIKPISLPSGEQTKRSPSGDAYIVRFVNIREENAHQQGFHSPIMEDFRIRFRDISGKDKILIEEEGKQFTEIGPDEYGGPLMINNVLYGVASYFFMTKGANGDSSIIMVYMNVNYYREFIDNAIKTLESKNQ